MRSRKSFDWGKEKYYFSIKSIPTNITINRKTREAAEEAYARYANLGKDVEWLGKWDGKKFIDNTAPKVNKD